jgi:hypothetical protein
MLHDWIRPIVIVGAVAILLTLNSIAFKAKRRAFARAFPEADADATPTRLARRQALQALDTEQLLHMIHTMLAAILAALLWR